ncbi:DUF4025 domain-containing protein [Paenalkalicoccus suaedae]|uniref:DUF4025 domain-containing protein n=1 Tax=Paenalkalicoccus suaedae TaxID=2592382 RepID=A0A859FE64_9BACI|nr:DUF4025 domain-containing protein [Paenalkalicoccus suaedae]QKS71181.1 DUF4025 domain-containing protein [Paenalkalicoccus suaedae]
MTKENKNEGIEETKEQVNDTLTEGTIDREKEEKEKDKKDKQDEEEDGK